MRSRLQNQPSRSSRTLLICRDWQLTRRWCVALMSCYSDASDLAWLQVSLSLSLSLSPANRTGESPRDRLRAGLRGLLGAWKVIICRPLCDFLHLQTAIKLEWGLQLCCKLRYMYNYSWVYGIISGAECTGENWDAGSTQASVVQISEIHLFTKSQVAIKPDRRFPGTWTNPRLPKPITG